MRQLLLGGCLIAPLLLMTSANTAAQSRVADAVAKGDKAAVGQLLKQRADVNAPQPDGTTALHLAAHRDDREIAELLVRAGANVKATNRYGMTPLSLACTNGNVALIQLLLTAGADPNAELPGGETALMTAARTGVADAVKALLIHGAKVKAKEGRRGQDSLMWAAAEGHVSAIQLLLEAGAEVQARSAGGFTPFLFAVRQGRMDAVRVLLAAGANVNDTLVVPTEPRRTERGDVAAEPAGGPSALVLAVENGHFELAAALLDAGADPNAAAQGWTALHHLTWIRKPGTAGNDRAPSGSGNMSSIEFARKLVAHGTTVNARVTRQGRSATVGATPFFLASKTADVELMRLLVELGADPLLPNANNTTPLMAAAGVGTRSPGQDAGTEPEALEAVKLLLELGGDINAVDKNGNTAMHGAAYKQLPSVVKLLAEKGTRIEIWNTKNKEGWTPLRIAAGTTKGTVKFHVPTADALREVMVAAGVSTALESNDAVTTVTGAAIGK